MTAARTAKNDQGLTRMAKPDRTGQARTGTGQATGQNRTGPDRTEQRFVSGSCPVLGPNHCQTSNWTEPDKTRQHSLHLEEEFETVHNYINFKDGIIRKGAVSAQPGEKLIIPLNMRDGSLIARGKGNPEWNYSAPHGAGRRLSRNQARKQLDMEDFKKVMKNVWTSTVSIKTLDEAPKAYKPKEEILQYISETVDIEESLKPLYNFKSE